ncbi:MAG: hypothetical protein WBN15_15575 [Polyangiales bacterium]
MSRLAAAWFVFVCFSAPACKPSSTETAADVRIVNTKPRCKKLGVVEGAGGDAAHARKDALEQAAERGATHILLESAHLDLEDEMTTVVTGRIFGCPPPDEVYPPTGYR